MSYASHIGRVGALAVALGVGLAVASSPGVAYAQTDSGSASATGDSSSTTSPPADASQSGEGAQTAGGSDPAAAPDAAADAKDDPSETVVGGDDAPVVVIGNSGGAQTADDEDEDAEETLPAAGDDDTPPAEGSDDTETAEEPASGQDDDPPAVSGGSDDSVDAGASSEPSEGSGDPAPTQSGAADDTGVVAADQESAGVDEGSPAELSDAEAAATPVMYAAASADALSTASVSVVAPAEPAPTLWDIADDVVNTVVSIGQQLISGVVTQLLDPASGSTTNPLLWVMAAFARKEYETLFASGPEIVYATPEDALALTAADPNQHVLMIGVDGTNLSSILADPYNQAFFDLMAEGTTAASTISGHTVISNPSWTAMLTGVQSETAGVSNNIFTPWTYDTWPTVFNQLETADPTIVTTAISDWSVIAQIAGAGSIPADNITYVTRVGDDGWEATDDAVGAATVAAIQNTVAGVPSFQFTHFVGVDNTGHDTTGSGTVEYANALRNVNDNIGDIMAAIDTWEATNPGEQWTVIVVTDHGQVADPLLGIGFLTHGFTQSPVESTTFIIARGPDFQQGAMNNTYRTVDLTPTFLELFDLPLEPYFAGMPLMDRAASDVIPDDLQLALQDAINMYGYPDSITTATLNTRVWASSVPIIVYELTGMLTAALPEAFTLPIQILAVVPYQLVNIPAQIIVRLTGVTGNQIIPPDLWPFQPVPGTQTVAPPAALTDPAILACGNDSLLANACIAI